MITFKQFLKESEPEKVGDEPPSEPESRPIPEGRVRRFHLTPTRNIPSIKQHGLQVSRSHDKGSGTVHGNGVYSQAKFKHAAKHSRDMANDDPPRHTSVIEFHDNPKHYEGHHASISEHDVPPKHIVAIHHHWHPSIQGKRKN